MPRARNEIREAALAAGQTRYFDGTPCPKGHIAERLTKWRVCVTCNALKTKKRYCTNAGYREQAKASAREHYAKVGTAWYHENKERASQQNKQWRTDHKDTFYTYCTNWRRDNLDKLSKNTAAYRAAKLQATPKWANTTVIADFYTKATQLTKQTGIQHTVDHIVPLNGKTVCGLHVQNNLQILTLVENSSKSNKVMHQ